MAGECNTKIMSSSCRKDLKRHSKSTYLETEIQRS